jgi:lipopolysaccharide/colanic/teichoic acid biosynthesis glycosyltransferase
MKNETSPMAYSNHAEMTIVKEDALLIAPVQLELRPELAGIINLKKLTTPIEIKNFDQGLIKFSNEAWISSWPSYLLYSYFLGSSPLLAILIKLDSKGPVFFTQQRNGFRDQLFTCLKFRTMIVNEEADLVPAKENDSRITRLGHFLRKHYIDELPQFINVLIGNMSLIGPRPHMQSDNLKYDALLKHYSMRHRVKPGITGLAQVLGYIGPADTVQKMEDRVHMDLFYVRHASLSMDLTILYRTFFKMLKPSKK